MAGTSIGSRTASRPVPFASRAARPPTGRSACSGRPSADRRHRRRRCPPCSGRAASPRDVGQPDAPAPSSGRRARAAVGTAPLPGRGDGRVVASRDARRPDRTAVRRSARRSGIGDVLGDVGRRGRRERARRPASDEGVVRQGRGSSVGDRIGGDRHADLARSAGTGAEDLQRAAPAATPRTSPRARKANSLAVTLSASSGPTPFGSTSAPGSA